MYEHFIQTTNLLQRLEQSDQIEQTIRDAMTEYIMIVERYSLPVDLSKLNVDDIVAEFLKK